MRSKLGTNFSFGWNCVYVVCVYGYAIKIVLIVVHLVNTPKIVLFGV